MLPPFVSANFVPHFISCTAAQGTIPEAWRQMGRSSALTSGCCHQAEGQQPSPSYLYAFSLSLAEEQSGSELSSKMAVRGGEVCS